jgi:DNA-binding transcriptional MerR regulator
MPFTSAVPAPGPGPSRAAGLLSIGQVLSLVQEEFPEVSHSKLHFLETQGLLSPERSPSGYRKYSRDDVDRLLFILRAQRDRFWPLKVIREHLQAAEAEAASIVRTDPAGETRLDRTRLCTDAQISEEFLENLEAYGLLPRRGDWFRQADLEIARGARTLADHGLEPRHLVMLRSAVDRQAHLVRSATPAGRSRRDPAAEGEAEETRQELTEAVIDIWTNLLRIVVSQTR